MIALYRVVFDNQPQRSGPATGVNIMPGRSAAHAFELWERVNPGRAHDARSVVVTEMRGAAVPLWAARLR